MKELVSLDEGEIKLKGKSEHRHTHMEDSLPRFELWFHQPKTHQKPEDGSRINSFPVLSEKVCLKTACCRTSIL